MIDFYDGPGGREAMLCLGPAQGPVVLVALPFWEEANRTRVVAVAMLRALARHGIGGVLPDWPGTGESLVETEKARCQRPARSARPSTSVPPRIDTP